MKKTRTRWFMKHRIQAKYLLIVLIAMLGPILLIGFCFYRVVFNLMAKQMVFPEAIMGNLVPVIEHVNGLLIVSLPLLILVVLVAAVIISHRFAGPIERMEHQLDKILAGQTAARIYLRRHDDLTGVATRINRLLDVTTAGK